MIIPPIKKQANATKPLTASCSEPLSRFPSGSTIGQAGSEHGHDLYRERHRGALARAGGAEELFNHTGGAHERSGRSEILPGEPDRKNPNQSALTYDNLTIKGF